MKRVQPLTQQQPMIQKAETILTKGAQIENLRNFAAATQEFFDIVLKSDTFGN